MTFTVRQLALPPGQITELDIPEPGIVRHVAIGGEEKRIAGANGKLVDRDPEATRSRLESPVLDS